MHWYRRYPEAALIGMRGLTLEECGAYNIVLDLIYVSDGSLPDDNAMIAHQLGVRVDRWRRLKERLVACGKLRMDQGIIRNGRADFEVSRALVGNSHARGYVRRRRKAASRQRFRRRLVA